MDKTPKKNDAGKRKVIKAAIPAVILIVGLITAGILYASKPVARKARPTRPAPLVEVMKASAGTKRVVVSAMGTVNSSRG